MNCCKCFFVFAQSHRGAEKIVEKTSLRLCARDYNACENHEKSTKNSVFEYFVCFVGPMVLLLMPFFQFIESDGQDNDKSRDNKLDRGMHVQHSQTVLNRA